jgi:C1q domain
MKLKIVVVDVKVSPQVKKWALRVGIPLAVLVSGGAVAWAAAGSLHTWSAGDTLSAADLNGNFNNLQGQITTAALAPRTPSAFRAWLTTAQSVPSTVGTLVAFDHVAHDLGSEYNAGTGTFTAKQAGLYHVQCGISFLSTPAGTRCAVIVFKNGGEVAEFNSHASSTQPISAAAVATVQLAAGDALTCQAWQNSSGAQPIGEPGLPERTSFEATRLY